MEAFLATVCTQLGNERRDASCHFDACASLKLIHPHEAPLIDACVRGYKTAEPARGLLYKAQRRRNTLELTLYSTTPVAKLFANADFTRSQHSSQRLTSKFRSEGTCFSNGDCYLQPEYSFPATLSLVCANEGSTRTNRFVHRVNPYSSDACL